MDIQPNLWPKYLQNTSIPFHIYITNKELYQPIYWLVLHAESAEQPVFLQILMPQLEILVTLPVLLKQVRHCLKVLVYKSKSEWFQSEIIGLTMALGTTVAQLVRQLSMNSRVRGPTPGSPDT